jgi:hypothetical protein
MTTWSGPQVSTAYSMGTAAALPQSSTSIQAICVRGEVCGVWIMRLIQAGLVVGVLVSCGRPSGDSRDGGNVNLVLGAGGVTSGSALERSTGPARGGTGNPSRDMLVDAGVSIQRIEAGHVELTTEEADKVFVGMFGNLARHSKEELRIIAFVESYLDRVKSKCGSPRRFLVYRERSGWVVRAMTLEQVKQMGRSESPEVLVHVVEERGQLRIGQLSEDW